MSLWAKGAQEGLGTRLVNLYQFAVMELWLTPIEDDSSRESDKSKALSQGQVFQMETNVKSRATNGGQVATLYRTYNCYIVQQVNRKYDGSTTTWPQCSICCMISRVTHDLHVRCVCGSASTSQSTETVRALSFKTKPGLSASRCVTMSRIWILAMSTTLLINLCSHQTFFFSLSQRVVKRKFGA